MVRTFTSSEAARALMYLCRRAGGNGTEAQENSMVGSSVECYTWSECWGGTWFSWFAIFRGYAFLTPGRCMGKGLQLPCLSERATVGREQSH